MATTSTKVSVALKLPQLQNLIKRDPQAYKDEFYMQKRHFDSELEIFKLRPTKDSDRFTELVTFMSHVVPCYKSECVSFPIELLSLIENNLIHSNVRIKLFQSLYLLRKKNMLDPLILIKLSFQLLDIQDKVLRQLLTEYIFNDIKQINIIKNNEKLNKLIKSYLYEIINSDKLYIIQKTIEILSDLYRKRIWTDSKTVNIIAIACKSKLNKVMTTSINFFLGIDNKILQDEEDEKKSSINDTSSNEVNYHEHARKTNKSEKLIKKQINKNHKIKRDINNKLNIATPLFPAIELIHNPDELIDALFKKLKSSNEIFDVKLLLMNFISRIIGCHKLIYINFYSFIQKYLNSHQKHVTEILAYLVQSCHNLIPGENLIPVLKTIATNFITERCSDEEVAVGINSIREIFLRIPSILLEDDMDTFIQDLALYSKKNHKTVMVASRSLINLIR